ncbi:bifunctional folylpolyglutamate synthase/dihydrofolate synthase [Caldinitratiruptor microaerophilus]|uniref:tetrahydrofolate synthase n=1 Tax=Caldinitratiruptor microaerophilus TaxID=671077 RepID=A0AA35CLH4_9FIRM|nr:folylpolyglutamate synthase/dihydrofolate synthase family protein [Caldinitratiruptor microaerophilus]BDG61515.1 bifunctional folylpolyglutamate synthase/dihydrofolate synthase [Caldinitratiruptor microaerophilus]
MKPGLERTRELLRRLGDPLPAPGRVVHVTGTNGKGSVCAMVAAGLRAAGYRVGLYTSPHLERWNERIQVDGAPLPDEDVAQLVAEVRPHVEAMVREGFEQPTEFEVSTAVAFLHFARRQVDWVVLEVGLGGRYDATNVVARPAVTCITNVDLDHVRVLGPTRERIAWDKAGILRPGVPCVTGADDPGALWVLRREAARVGAPLVLAPPALPRGGDLYGQRFDLPGLPGLELRLAGRYQLRNAAVAAAVLRLCGVDEAALRAGLRTAEWPGRLEVLREEPLVLADGAHNPAGARALRQALDGLLPERPRVLVLGVLADKQLRPLLDALVPGARAVVATAPRSVRRALAADELARYVLPYGVPVTVEPELERAVDRAALLAGPDGAVVITGSLYLVGPARAHALSVVSSE